MYKTVYFEDFKRYYEKAKILQDKVEGLVPQDTTVGDPLMDNVHIYDCIERRMAGFSNVLQDIHDKRSPKHKARLKPYKFDLKTYHFIYLFHRYTGSGASFEEDHGYRNSHVEQLCEIGNIDGMIQYIVENDKPIVTSKGNQPPSAPKSPKYKLALQNYFDNYSKQFINDYVDMLLENDKPIGIKQAVDWCCSWNKKNGLKQWKFVFTAFVMDTAEYHPEYVNPSSHCYYGANCIKAMDLMFKKPSGKRINNSQWYEQCMSELVSITNNKPYNLEDVLCDMIRYWNCYVPANGYNHLSKEELRNNSLISN